MKPGVNTKIRALVGADPREDTYEAVKRMLDAAATGIRFTRKFRAAVDALVTNDGVDTDTYAGGWTAALDAVLNIMGPMGRNDIDPPEAP